MERVRLDEGFASFSEHWSPRIAGDLNGQQVKLAKFKGAFDWHSHEHEDEMFLVHKGSFEMHFRDRVVELRAGDLIVVPRGVEHRPMAEDEAEVVLFEPATTVNTGAVVSERTLGEQQRLDLG